jgi:hypothetical protein
MKSIGQLFFRITSTILLVLFTIAIFPTFNKAIAQSGSFTSDDFNRCSVNTSLWKFENPGNIPDSSPVISGQYSGDSLIKMTVPSGQAFTFSDTNKLAPRIMQAISDEDFDIEVKFQAPINSSTADWKIQGVLVRDASNPSQPKWFRFDFNSHNGTLNSYHGYINSSGGLVHIQNVKDLPGANPATGPLFLRVKYVKSTGTWTVTHQVGASGALVSTLTFQESTYDPNFVVTDFGVFVGSTGTNPPGHTVQVDYIKNQSQASFSDDAIALTVDKAGTGQGTVNWPLTNANQCSGTTVTLTASPNKGSKFAGWSGDLTGTQQSIQVPMSTAKHMVATFTLVQPVDLPYSVFLPWTVH